MIFSDILSGKIVNPSLDQFTDAHLELEAKKRELLGQHPALLNEVLDLQAQDLGGGSPGKKLVSAKERLQDVEQKIHAAKRGQETLQQMMVDKLIKDAGNRKDTGIPRDFEALSKEREKLNKQFLIAVAAAVELEERLLGRALTYYQCSGEWAESSLSLRMRFDSMDGEDRLLLTEEVNRLRTTHQPSGFEAMECRMDHLRSENTGCEKILEGNGAEKEMKRLLKAAGSKVFEEKAPEAEPYHPMNLNPRAYDPVTVGKY